MLTFSRAVRQRFLREERGNIAIIFGLAMIPLLAFGGGAVDLSKATRTEQMLQRSMDAALLAGVSGTHTNDEQIAVATAYFAANRSSDAQVGTPSITHSGERLVGTVTANVPTSFLRVIGMSTIPVSVNSVATTEQLRETACVMAMHPTRKHTLELNGSVSVIGPACNFYGNSTNPDDVVDPHNSTNFLTGKSVQANGYGHHYIENVTPPLEHAPEVLTDPLAAMTIPVPSATCLFTSKVVNGGTAALGPGTYCNGLTIKGGATVTLSPGLYIITLNRFQVDTSTLTGTGVTIVLADDHAKIDWQSSTIRLSAPTTGAQKSMVMMGSRTPTDHSIDKGTIDLEGVVYLPQGAFTWTNTGTPTLTGKWVAWIVDGFSWDGDGTISMPFDIEHGTVPYPDELRHVVPRPGTPRLVT